MGPRARGFPAPQSGRPFTATAGARIPRDDPVMTHDRLDDVAAFRTGQGGPVWVRCVHIPLGATVVPRHQSSKRAVNTRFAAADSRTRFVGLRYLQKFWELQKVVATEAHPPI